MNFRKIAMLCVLVVAPALAAQEPAEDEAAVAAAAAASPWTIEKVVDGNTPCPGGKGSFNPVSGFPAIFGQWVVFVDGGDDNCTADNGESLWSYNLITKKLTKLADTNTLVPVPAGSGKFTSFIGIATDNLQVRDGTVVFHGYDSKTNSKYHECGGGVYSVNVGGGNLQRVVDYSMKLPGQEAFFCGLNSDYGITGIDGMSIDQGKVVFSAQGTGNGYADAGVWWAPSGVNTTYSELHLIADSTTPYHSKFPKGCTEEFCWIINEWEGGNLGGANIAFTGAGGNPGPYGLFLNSPTNPILLSNYILPGDNAPDTGHPNQSSFYFGPVVDGNRVFFIGNDPFYKGSCGATANSGKQGWFTGVFVTSLAGGTATSLMNSCKNQPNGDHLIGNNSFNYLSANDGTAVFQVLDNKTGDYVLDSWVGGKVTQMIAPGDPLPTGASCDGKYHAEGCVTDVSPPGSDGMSGGRVVFSASGGPYWYDEGIYVASLACAKPAATTVSVELGKPVYNAKTETWSQTATVVNKGKTAVAGPLSLALTKVEGGASLVNRDGVTVCFATPASAYVNLPLSANLLGAGKSVERTLEYTAKATAKIEVTAELAGPGAR